MWPRHPRRLSPILHQPTHFPPIFPVSHGVKKILVPFMPLEFANCSLISMAMDPFLLWKKGERRHRRSFQKTIRQSIHSQELPPTFFIFFPSFNPTIHCSSSIPFKAANADLQFATVQLAHYHPIHQFHPSSQMSFFKEVRDRQLTSADLVPALPDYLPNSIIYTIFYLAALPPNLCLLYMGMRAGLITSRVKFPTLGMTLANLFGLVGFLFLNFVYLWAVLTETRLTLFMCSLLRTIFYNTSYVCYFLFPVLAVDQYLFICQNFELKIRWLKLIVAICFLIPMIVAVYDLLLQDIVLYDFMFRYIRMSLYTNMFFFFVLAPSFFAFSFICNLLVLFSIIHRQSKSSRKQLGRTLNSRQLQQHKSIIYTYILQAFLPLALATPYYIAYLCFMFDVDIPLNFFIIGEGIIALHPLSNALITLFLLRPYREALKKIRPWPGPCQRLLFGADNRVNNYNAITTQDDILQDGAPIDGNGTTAISL